jgi:hypothetical protein
VCSKVFVDFYDWWIQQGKEKNFPVHFVRFEDLISNKEEVLNGAMSFAFGVPDIEGTYI